MLSVTRITLVGAIVSCVLEGKVYAQKDKPVDVWLTDPVHSIFFQEQPRDLNLEKGNALQGPVIKIDDGKGLQEMDGFGFALTGGSAQHIIRMSPAARGALLRQAFRKDTKINVTTCPRRRIGALHMSGHGFSLF